MKRIVPAAAFALCALPVVAAPNMQPGLWEITVKAEVAGMPAMPAATARQCIRPADIEDGRRTVPQDNKDPKCAMKDYKIQGNTANWRMECRGPEAMSGSGSITYSGTSYSGATKMTMKQGGQSMDMTQSFSGKRVGDCK